MLFIATQGLSPVLHDAHGAGAHAARGAAEEEGEAEGAVVRQGVDGGRLREGDGEHGVQLSGVRFQDPEAAQCLEADAQGRLFLAPPPLHC